MSVIIQKLSFAALGLFVCSNLAACDAQVEQDQAFVRTSQGQEISIEVAVSPQEQAQGLMWREELDANAGMLFVYDHEAPRSFWMKNTLIPLDIIYIDSEGIIVDIQTMPPCPADATGCPSYPSSSPAQYALEINAGRAAELGLEAGDRLELSY